MEIPKFNKLNLIASVASSRIRRFMEGPYDMIEATELFQRYKQQSPTVKTAVEYSVYGLTALLDQTLDEATPLRKFFKDVLNDLGPELFGIRAWEGSEIKKRLVDGIREIDISAINKNAILNVIQNMKDDDVKPFLEWINGMDDKDKKRELDFLKGLSQFDLTTYAKLEQDVRNLLSKAAEEPKGEKKESKGPFRGMSKTLRQQMQNYLNNDKGGSK